MKKISIAVIDDHKLVREMWKQLFARNPEIEVTGESGQFDDAINMVRNLRPDVVLLDINLAEHSGFDAVPLIRKYAPAAKIIAVSMHSQPAYAKKMLALGAKGYMTKNSSSEEVIKAVKEVMAGKTYICVEIKDILSDQMLNNTESGPDIKLLSLREIEIVKLIQQGMSSKEIAAHLNITVRTAEVHRHNILKKLQLKNTAALVSYINKTDLGS